jgi:hypothetical protein
MAKKSKTWVARVLNWLVTGLVLSIAGMGAWALVLRKKGITFLGGAAALLAGALVGAYLVFYKWIYKGKVPYFEVF